ncbi:MAG: sigma-70 family RNA polymerase sigma factor [Wenzhouxiangellaceae bacterium]|nr:sigma-70 family RNA polymerase sigma factor [Wenzhouxiangellaceae bacterium]
MAPERLSFEELWRRIAPHVRAAVTRHRSRDAALAADDLVQEVRIRIWQVYERDRNARFRASYYYTVVNSAIVDCLRRHRGTLAHAVRDEPEPGEADDPLERVDNPEPGPDQRFDDELRARRLQAAIDALPADRARAVSLFLQGFTVPEIAELMNCDRDRAHNLAYRGMRALKSSMQDNQGEE